MAPLNLGLRLTRAAEALRSRASHATTVLGHTRAVLDSRKVVHQAIGMLMHEYNLNQAAALEVLERRASNAGAQVLHTGSFTQLVLEPSQFPHQFTGGRARLHVSVFVDNRAVPVRFAGP